MEKALCCVNRKKITILGLNSLFSKLSSFLLKQSPHINRLALYDECDTNVANDISHINTQCKIRAYVGPDQLGCAVKNADIVLIGDQEDVTTLVPHHKRCLQRESTILLEYAYAIAEHAPNAIVLVATTPVNSLLPLVSEFLIDCGVYDCNKILGVTSVDNVRANKLAADFLKMDPGKVVLPVIGGSSPDTRVPIFSQARPCLNIPRKKWLSMTWEIKNAETVIQRSRGRGESVNKAYASVRLIHSVLAALRGEPNIAEIVLARTILVPDTPYFALPVILGPKGIMYRFNLPALTQSETCLVEHAAKCVNRDVEAGLQYLCSRYFKNEKTIETRGLMGNLLKKIRGKEKVEVTQKPEYLLMTDKKITDFNPEFKPSNDPINIPFVENDYCPNCNKGCNPIKLPIPPSKPRRSNKMPSNYKDTDNTISAFPPCVSKQGEKFDVYKSNSPKCDYCNKSIEFCTCEHADKSPFGDDCSNQAANLPPKSCDSQALTIANVKEERIKMRAQRLLEERQREAKRRSRKSRFTEKKGIDMKNSCCPNDNKTITELKDKKEDKKCEPECKNNQDMKDYKAECKDNQDSTKIECKNKQESTKECKEGDGNKKAPPSGEKDVCAEKKDETCKEYTKKKVDTTKNNIMKFSAIWPKRYGNQEDLCDLKREGINKTKIKLYGTEYSQVAKKVNTEEPQVKKEYLPTFLFPSNLEPLSNILSKKKNLLNKAEVKRIEPNTKSSQIELNKEPRDFISKCLSFLKCDTKPRKVLKKENRTGIEKVENKIPTECKKKTNQNLIEFLNSPQINTQKVINTHMNECKSIVKNELCKIESLTDKTECQSIKQKNFLNSIATPLPPVLTQEHAKIQEKINQFSKLRAEQLSKVYAPKCPSHFLHGHYPDYCHLSQAPKDTVVKPKEFSIPVVRVQDFEGPKTKKEFKVQVFNASNELNVKVKSPINSTIPIAKDPKNYTINAPKNEFPVIKIHKELSESSSKMCVQSKSVHTDEANKNLSPLYMTKSRSIQTRTFLVAPPSSEEVQANFSKNLEALAKLNSQGCQNCGLCKKCKHRNNHNISVKVTSPVHREFGVSARDK